jgi:hypothetical protein
MSDQMRAQLRAALAEAHWHGSAIALAQLQAWALSHPKRHEYETGVGFVMDEMLEQIDVIMGANNAGQQEAA